MRRECTHVPPGSSRSCARSSDRPRSLRRSLLCCPYVSSLFTLFTSYHHALYNLTFFLYKLWYLQSVLIPYTRSLQFVIDIEKRHAFLDHNNHHGFRAGYLDPPQASGRRLFPPTIDLACLRSPCDQNTPRHRIRQAAAVHRPRYITAVLELDRGLVHAATAWQPPFDPVAGAVDARVGSIEQPPSTTQQQQ
jgi:hypothetical protein